MSATSSNPSILGRIFSSPIFWIAFVTLGFGLPVMRNLLRPQLEPLPVLGQLPNFELLDQNNQKINFSSYRGNVVIVNFIFTSCPDVCPLLSAQMAKIQERTATAGGSIKLVSISVDPQTDTPAVLAKYATKFNARRAQWAFLTGPLKQIEDTVVGSFKVAMKARDPDTSLMDVTHSEKFVLIDQIGQIRAYRSASNNEDINLLLKDVAMLLNMNPLQNSKALGR
jgi:protein SCO1/2